MVGSRRSAPLPPGWARIRRDVLRQEPFCATCGDDATEVDHVIPASEGGQDVRSNLQALCGPCHRAKTAREAAARRHRNPVARPAEPHPGRVDP